MWQWERIDPARNPTSGDIAKLFKNEAIKQPGVMAVGAPPADATLLAREAIQNSWDAGRQLARELREQGIAPPKFRVRFVYRSYVSDEKAAMVDALGLRELAARADAGDRRKLGLAEDDCLLHLDDPGVPLQVLQVVETATTGMDGPWTGAASKLYLAMVSVGFTVKDEGSGGSYGYGKGGLIRGSRTRTVVAHTCFRERPDDPGVTRRLLGMTYWGADDDLTGFARLGDPVGPDAVEPLVGDAADVLAGRVHIGLRDPAQHKDLGSTFLLLDSTIAPDDLCRAVERSWWPAIVDDEVDFDVSIETDEGHLLAPRPLKDDVLRSFVRGYELALSLQDNQPDHEYRKDLRTYQPSGGPKKELGTLGLVADLASWSYAQGRNNNNNNNNNNENVDHQSLVALVRGPRMVVEYYSVGRNQPFVRGTFVAHDDIDDLLRQTEPKLHDAWLDKLKEEGIDPHAPKFAREVLKRIRDNVREFRRQLKPPPPREQDIRLPLLDDLFRSILENRGSKNPPPPPHDPRLVAIRVEQQVEAVSDSLIRVRATVGMRLTDNHADDEAECRLAVRLAFDEDGRRGDDCPVTLPDPPPGFEVRGHEDGKGTILVGQLSHDWTDFDVESLGYDADWSAQLLLSGDPTTNSEPASGEHDVVSA